jgi:FixJ family two-component response regulator
MATATALFERVDEAFLCARFGSPPVAARERELAQIEPSAVVHVIHPDEHAATDMAQCWDASGARTRFHADLAAFLSSVRPDAPGCLVIHVRCAGETATATAAALPIPDQNLPTIFTSDRADLRAVVLAMKAGAVDFLVTPLSHRDLRCAVEQAIRADRARRDIQARCSLLVARFGTLTRREREVMKLVTQGLLNKQVAGDLGLSEITVKVHRGSVMRKMCARTLADLVRMADVLANCAAF